MFKKLVTITLFALFISACSSSGKLTQTSEKQAVIDHTAAVALSISPGSDTSAQDFANRLQDRLFGQLVSQKVFHSVNPKDNQPKYDLDIQVVGATKVPGVARVLFGVLAGSNKVVTDVTLTDRETGEVITTFKAEGASAAHPFSSEAGAEDAIREVSEQIVTGLL